jgi:hypothetical protein
MRARRPIPVVVAMVAVLLLVLAAPAAEGKSKKAKGSSVFNSAKTVGAMVPEASSSPDGPYGLLTSTIDAGKRFKGRVIRDVNVTVQTTGVTGNNPSNDLVAYLSAPNGSTSLLFAGLGGVNPGQAVSIGPLTLDDDTVIHLFSPYNPGDPLALKPPFAGTAQPGETLAPMNSGAVRGTWTLRILDTFSGGAETSRLDSWSLNVATGKPYRAK